MSQMTPSTTTRRTARRAVGAVVRPDLALGPARSSSSVPRWYVTAHTTRSERRDGELVERPVSVAHAKRMGTLTAACGAWADSWPKMHDLPFPMPAGERAGAATCPRCLDVISEEWKP